MTINQRRRVSENPITTLVKPAVEPETKMPSLSPSVAIGDSVTYKGKQAKVLKIHADGKLDVELPGGDRVNKVTL